MEKITVNVRFDKDFTDSLLRFGEGLGSTLAVEMMPEIARIHAEARRSWPVKTGRSREELAYGARLKPGVVRVGIYDTAPYTMFIRTGMPTRNKKRPYSDPRFLAYLKQYPAKGYQTGQRDGESVWVKYVSAPFRAARKVLAAKIEDAIAAEIGLPPKKRRARKVKEDPKL